jgi:hypothetical protein
MSTPEEKKAPTEEETVAAMWQIPYTCESCRGTLPLTNQTTECILCKKPVDGAAAMRSFWTILHDEKAWREWHANNNKGTQGTDDWMEEEDGTLVVQGQGAVNLLSELGAKFEVAIEPDKAQQSA